MYTYNHILGENIQRKPQKKVQVLLIGLIAILFVGIGLNLLWGNEAYGSNEEVVVVVQPGDTLWSIANENYQGKDIQEAIYYIKKANRLKSGNLQIGTVLHLPVF
ncbi:LysM peptidoglycan-binding domain-containing protein [Effusibacillus consociatus]|uniref:LysM peptidoglycan-binding domain-containing protein n=1 Tax=Effusibacillus consociatus TaxID=1117041 RepID=A0ABV9Q169_9BACL